MQTFGRECSGLAFIYAKKGSTYTIIVYKRSIKKAERIIV